MPNDADLVDLLSRLPGTQTRTRVLVNNPARL
jgi:hypothetical protein